MVKARMQHDWTPNLPIVGTSISEPITWTTGRPVIILLFQQITKAKDSENVTQSAVKEN